jgi:4-hydroxy-4-methyl-2-oxoglutarate aldolase
VTVVGTGKEHPGRFGVPVRVGGVVIRPGDLVVGDADGVVVIPAPSVATTLAEPTPGWRANSALLKRSAAA